MLVLQHGNDTVFNVQLFECLLSLKRDLIQDVLCAIAYGAYKVRYHATNLLFRYWPKLNPNRSDRNIHYHIVSRKPALCDSAQCDERKNLAYKICIDPNFSIHGENVAPPFNLCNECCREIPKRYQFYSHNILNPADVISLYCENRNCKSTTQQEKLAHVVCYSSPCIIGNQNKPISFCKNCHLIKHQRLFTSNEHIFQTYLDNIWQLDNKTKTYLKISIINLLKEVPIFELKRNMESDAEMKTKQMGNMGLNTMLGSNTTGMSNELNLFNRSSNLPPTIQTAKGDLTNLIGVGLIGALNTNGFSNTSALASNLFASGSSSDESSFNKRLLSRYGCYLIISLIDPTEYTSEIETFGRIISMLLQWFHLVCYIPSDASGEIISKLRTRFILPWIKSVTENHFELVVSSFLPFPAEFTKVGGVWETKSSTSIQIRDEFTKFCDLITYEIVNYKMWDYAMPFWIDAIINDVPEKDINEFKSLFSKLFDPDMAPFKLEQMYHFIRERFDGTSSVVQEQALSWIQILCELDVNVPLSIMLDIFTTGLNSLQKLESRAMRRREAVQCNEANGLDSEQAHFNQVLNNNSFTVFDTYDAYKVYRGQLMLQRMTGQELANLIKEEEEDFIINNSELNITCCIMMLDMLLKQFEVQRPQKHLGVNSSLSKELLILLNKNLILPWIKKHKCKQQQFAFSNTENTAILTNSGAANYCPFCEEYIMWFSFAKELLIYILPSQEVNIPEVNFHALIEQISLNESIKNARSSMPKEAIDAFAGTLASSFVVDSKASKSFDLGDDEINEENQINLTDNETSEQDSKEETADSADSADSQEKKPPPKRTNPEAGIWVTSDGIYYFKLTQLQPQHQILYSLLKELYRVPDVDAFFNLLISLKMLILHADCLETAFKEQKGFLIFCLEKLLIPNLWKLFSASFCHLNDYAVPLLIHSLVYESGQATFWSLVKKDFNDDNWKIRMQAVSRVIAIAQNLNSKKIKSINYHIFSSLAFAFANLINAIHDIEPIVAQKAISLIETLTEDSIKTIITCLQLQFDCVIQDRPFIIRMLTYLYTNVSKNNQTVLSWEFFCQRFNAFSLELQLTHDTVTPVDIYGYNELHSNSLQRKLNIAKFALKRSDIIKSISNEEQNELKNELSYSQMENLNNKIMTSMIALLMQFMAHDNQNICYENRSISKHQTVMLKHLEFLIRYSSTEKRFISSPHVLRNITTVNAFLAGLPLVLDRNLELGKLMLNTVLSLLHYIPVPSIDLVTHLTSSQATFETNPPNFSIGHLNSQARYYWIQSLLIILYKYEYNHSSCHEVSKSLTSSIKYLIQIVINTLNFQYHKCELSNCDAFGVTSNNQYYDEQSRASEFSIDAGTHNNIVVNGNNNLNDDDSLSNKSYMDKLIGSKSLRVNNKKSLIHNLNQSELDYSKANSDSIKEKRKGFMPSINFFSHNRYSKKRRNVKVTPTNNVIKLSRRHRITVRISSLFTTTTSRKNRKKLKNTKRPKNSSDSMKRAESNSNRKRSSHIFSHNVNSKLNTLYRNSMVKMNASALRSGGFSADGFFMNSSEYGTSLQDEWALEEASICESFLNSQSGICYIHCQRCSCRLEYYNEDTIGSLIVLCSMLVYRECTLAAPFILDMIIAIMRIAKKKVYSWQMNSNFYLPGNYTSISKQFLRCTLHQLANNEIFFQLFQCELAGDSDLLEVLANSLQDFNELNSVAALRQVLCDINLQKTFNMDVCMTILNNVAAYMEYLPLESQQAQWAHVITELETLFHQMYLNMNKSTDYTCLFLIMATLLKVNYTSTCKAILDPFSKLLCFILQNCSFKLVHLVDICSLSNRAFGKDRAKQFISKCIINELMSSINVKVSSIDRNLLQMLQLAVLDSGGNIYKSSIIEDETELYDPYYFIQTNTADSLKLFINDIIVFIANIHSINRIKRDLKMDKFMQSCKTDDSLGAQLKAGLAQFLALEFTELNKSKDRDSRSIVKYLPWLSNLPTNHQQGAKEFVDCIDHIRFLSWILIGSLTHSALTRNKGTVISYPIPINCGHYIGEHIFYVLNGFAEHSKTSAIHMSSLFHSFILCQLWTMYCEQIHVTFDTENESSALNAIMEFWVKITPGILQLLSQTKVDFDQNSKELTDMVTLHFLSLIEGLQQYNSLVLAKFFPMWVPVLFMTQLQGDQLKRAKQCLNYQPPAEIQLNISSNYNMLLKCLQRLQYKIAMIEQQSSNAAMLYN